MVGLALSLMDSPHLAALVSQTAIQKELSLNNSTAWQHLTLSMLTSQQFDK